MRRSRQGQAKGWGVGRTSRVAPLCSVKSEAQKTAWLAQHGGIRLTSRRSPSPLSSSTTLAPECRAGVVASSRVMEPVRISGWDSTALGPRSRT